MLRVLGHPSAVCDGHHPPRVLLRRDARRGRREQGAYAPRSPRPDLAGAPAKAVILLDLFGGPSHIDTFDPKPDAPPEIRGEFTTIPTVLPGIRVCEHLPLLATPARQARGRAHRSRTSTTRTTRTA